MSMGTCTICDCNSKLTRCSLCQVICCSPCFESHQASCSVMKELHFHMCNVDRDQQVCGYCQHCSELICEKCRCVHHKNHVILPMKTALDNIRKDMPKVGQDVHMKYDQLKTTMGIQEKDHLLSQQKMGTSIQPTNQHLQLELLQEAKTNFDFLGNESFPLAFLSKWLCGQHALTKYKQLLSTTTESPQSHEQMTSQVTDISQTFGNSVINYDGTQVSEPSKDKTMDEMEKISERFTNVVNIDGKSGLDLDGMDDDFVHVINATDTSNNKDKRDTPEKKQVVKLQNDKEHALAEGDQEIKQCQRVAEENAQLRCTIERSEEQIAEMSKQLGLHQQEKDYILSMATSMMPQIADINERKVIVNSYKLDRPEDISVGSFVDNMELFLVCVTAMKNDLLITEGNLAAKIAYVANWTDKQRQTEDGLNTKIQDQAKTIDAQDKELKIRLSRIQEIQKINSAYEGIKNENNKLRQQIHDNEKKADQQQRNQSHMNDELKRSLHNMNTELQQRAAHIESLQHAMQDLQYQIAQKDNKIKDFKREAEDLRTRLSSLAGDKLTKGNPAITDLGDPNRPMKLAEKYGELYDNEWTDALDSTEEMKALYPNMKPAEIEEVIIRHLYQLVMCCYRECLVLSKEQLKEVENTIVNALNLNTEKHDGDIPGCKEISTFRRQTAAKYADFLFKHKVFVDKIVLSDWEYVHKSKELVGLLMETPFFEKCVNICWHMAIQDPVMHLDKELTPDAPYDKGTYRDFVKSGDKVTYVVWPALFLHEGGPLLNKGVVQAYC